MLLLHATLEFVVVGFCTSSQNLVTSCFFYPNCIIDALMMKLQCGQIKSSHLLHEEWDYKTTHLLPFELTLVSYLFQSSLH
jgi:hypothetical protein